MPSSGQTAYPVPPPSGGVSLPVSVADGGTGATTAAGARSNLGIVGTGGWPSGAFGAGTDGTVDFDGTNTFAFATKAGSIYTLSRTVWAQNVTVRSGVTVNKPYTLYVKGTLTIEATGILADNGNNASGVSAGGAVNNARIPESAGSAGGAGRSIAGSGTGGTSVTAAHGGMGGTGGDPSGASAGGSGGGVTAPTTQQNRIRDGLHFLASATIQGGTSQVLANGGSGGGGGGLALGTGTGTTGGGGGGAPVSMLFAATIANSGKITNNGGNGANAVSATNDAQSGGGGGGGGGYLVIVSNTPQSSAGTIEVLGGTGGTSLGAGCTDALPGNAGTLDYRGP